MNQLINDEGVCRTAPATPGLLKINESFSKDAKKSAKSQNKLFFFNKKKCIQVGIYLTQAINMLQNHRFPVVFVVPLCQR